jgi:CBS domain-containing protein
MDLTPTTSLTVAMVVADCLAVALLERRGFKPEDFRFLHPGGVLGRAASRRVDELMHAGEFVPRVAESAGLREVMLLIMEKRLGMTAVVDAAGRLAGVVSDGDFKRILIKHPTHGSSRRGDHEPHASTISRGAPWRPCANGGGRPARSPPGRGRGAQAIGVLHLRLFTHGALNRLPGSGGHPGSRRRNVPIIPVYRAVLGTGRA